MSNASELGRRLEAPPQQVRSKPTLRHRISVNRHVYLWVSPFVVFFLVIELYPTIQGFSYSAYDWNGFSAPTWVGLGNYVALVHDPIFWQAAGNTVVLLVLIVPLRTLAALVLAYVINSAFIKRKQFFAFFLLLPNITAIVVVGIIFRLLLSTDAGPINGLLHVLGVGPVPWLDSAEWSKVSVAILNLWKATGYFSILMLAGLQQIPRSVYEAAEIDGAGPIRTFVSITIPQMRNVILFVVITSTIWIIQNVADAMVLTQGGPQYSSTPLMYYMFINAFQRFNLGYAAALSVILFAIMAALSGATFAANRRTVK